MVRYHQCVVVPTIITFTFLNRICVSFLGRPNRYCNHSCHVACVARQGHCWTANVTCKAKIGIEWNDTWCIPVLMLTVAKVAEPSLPSPQVYKLRVTGLNAETPATNNNQYACLRETDTNLWMVQKEPSVQKQQQCLLGYLEKGQPT